MARLVVSSSDLVLAAVISFWTGVVETEGVRDIQDCCQLITTLRAFLQHNKAEQLKSNLAGGSKVDNNQENISKQVQSDDLQGGVADPVKSLETKSNTDDSDLDDLFEVIDPTEEKIKEERKDSEATEETRKQD